jgi:hypothetical protein
MFFPEIIDRPTHRFAPEVKMHFGGLSGSNELESMTGESIAGITMR